MLRLPRSAWLVLAGDAFSAMGTGLTIPFAVVYLHTIRGVPVAAASACVSVLAVTGFVANPLGGWLADRLGPRAAVAIGVALSAAGSFAIAGVHSTAQGFAAFALFGFGVCVSTPALDALLAVVVEPEQRSTVFSMRHFTLNAGMAIGGLAAAVVLNHATSSRFVVLYVIDGATFLISMPVLLFVRVKAAAPVEGDDERAGGFRLVLRDPAFRRVWLLTAGIFAFGFGQFASVFPAYMGRPGGIAPGAIGVVFAANTIAVVAVQLPVLRFLAGRARHAALAVTCGVWVGAWALTAVAGSSVVLFVVVALVFGVGETFLSPSMGPLVNDLAPDHLRGRYNGLNTLALTTGTALGPLFGGALLGADWGRSLFVLLAGGCAGLALFAGRLGRHLPAAANRIGGNEPGAEGAVAAVLGEGV